MLLPAKVAAQPGRASVALRHGHTAAQAVDDGPGGGTERPGRASRADPATSTVSGPRARAPLTGPRAGRPPPRRTARRAPRARGETTPLTRRAGPAGRTSPWTGARSPSCAQALLDLLRSRGGRRAGASEPPALPGASRASLAEARPLARGHGVAYFPTTTAALHARVHRAHVLDGAGLAELLGEGVAAPERAPGSPDLKSGPGPEVFVTSWPTESSFVHVTGTASRAPSPQAESKAMSFIDTGPSPFAAAPPAVSPRLRHRCRRAPPW